MLLEFNNFLGQYDFIFKLIWAVFPIIITIIMAFIAHEQYKITLHTEYNKVSNDFKKNFKKTTEINIEKIFDIISDKYKSRYQKQTEIIDLISEIYNYSNKYENFIERYDVQLIANSGKEIIYWLESTRENKWNSKEFSKIFSLLSKNIAYMSFVDYCYIRSPNKTITLYNLLSIILKKIYKFLVPYGLQKIIKKYICPIIMKQWLTLMLLYFYIILLISRVKPIDKVVLFVPNSFEVTIINPNFKGKKDNTVLKHKQNK